MLMSDAGSGNSLVSVDVTFDDAASSVMPSAAQIISGTYKPTDYEPGDPFLHLRLLGTYGTSLSAFNGSPLTVSGPFISFDDTGGDAGSIAEVEPNNRRLRASHVLRRQ